MRGRAIAELAGAAALGALQTVAFVDGDLWPLQMIAIALLAWRVGASTPARAALLGFLFGVGWLCAGTWWMYVSMHRYGGLSAGLAALAVLALAAFLSLYLEAAMALVARWRPRAPLRAALLFGAAWLLAELARGVLLTGFPWVASGYAYVDAPLAGFASWLGVYGVGAVGATLADRFGFADLRRARAWVAPGGVLVVALVAGALLGRVDFTTPTRALTVSLLQGNVPQEEKFDGGHLDSGLTETAAQVEAARGELVVGPETVIPVLFTELDEKWWEGLLERFRAPGRAALLGIPMGDAAATTTRRLAAATRAADRLLSLRQAPPGAVRRVRSDRFHWFTER